MSIQTVAAKSLAKETVDRAGIAHSFQVWAPHAKELELVTEVGDRQPRYEMQRAARGWWQTAIDLGANSIDYGFSIDRGPVLPDPRSPWQPNGVDGLSRTIDHTAFRWTDKHWQAPPLVAASLYELHIGTFTPEGTFEAAIEKLDHLVELGITHVEIMPVAEFRGIRGWGYDGVDLYAPHHAYGGPEGLKRLINACHARGLGVLLDVVYNHLGPTGNYLPKFGPYFTDRHKTPWGSALNFDGPMSDEVRRFFCDNALMWLRDYHFDGLRIDAVHAIIDSSAVHFLEQLATEVDELKAHLGRHLVLIAESDLNDPRIVRPWEVGGFGIDAQWSDDIHHALHSVLTGERDGYYCDFGSIAHLAEAMSQPYVYAGRHSEFRGRRHGRPPLGLRGGSFVAYLQNHDQLGNRAQGDRISHLANIDRQKIGAALIHLSPFIPMLFQGEEWAASSPFPYFVDFSEEPELAAAVTKGRCSEFAAFGWDPADIPDPQSEKTFRCAKLEWEEVSEGRHAEMLAWHRSLIRLRRTINAFTDGRLDAITTSYDERAGWLRIDRGSVSIVCNFADRSIRLPMPESGRRELLVASNADVNFHENSIILPSESIAVIHFQDEDASDRKSITSG